MIKAIIFDFFGVLVGDGFEYTYRYAGGDPDKDKNFIQKLLDQTNRGNISSEDFQRQICEKLGITVEEYLRVTSQTEQVNLELLSYIKKLRPKYKTAILSNANIGSLERRVEREVLEEYFDAIIISAEVAWIKPEPEIYNLAADKLGVKVSECVFIDDRERYVVAAQEIGMKAIFYKNFSQMKTELEKTLAADSDN